MTVLKTIDLPMDRIRMSITIKGVLEDSKETPIENARISVVKSDPMIINSPFYKEEVQTDKK